MKILSVFTAAMLTLSAFSLAKVIEEGTGIVYGENHVFSFTAPKGWVLDTESTPKTRVHAAFYPKDSTWKDSKVVAYATARTKTATLKSVDDVVTQTLKAIQADDNPKAQVRLVGKLPNGQGKEISIYVYFGDKNGNFEAAAYAEEDKTVNALIYTSRDEKAFRDSFPNFEAIAKSYVFIADAYDLKTLNAARAKAEKQGKAAPAEK
jgi:hypothetical protein